MVKYGDLIEKIQKYDKHLMFEVKDAMRMMERTIIENQKLKDLFDTFNKCFDDDSTIRLICNNIRDFTMEFDKYRIVFSMKVVMLEMRPLLLLNAKIRLKQDSQYQSFDLRIKEKDLLFAYLKDGETFYCPISNFTCNPLLPYPQLICKDADHYDILLHNDKGYGVYGNQDTMDEIFNALSEYLPKYSEMAVMQLAVLMSNYVSNNIKENEA